MKEIKNYLHLYLGCECKTPDGIMVLSCIDLHRKYPVWFNVEWNNKKQAYEPGKTANIIRNDSLVGKGFYYNQINLILRPLSDINDSEVNECEYAMWGNFQDAHTGNKKEFLKSFNSLYPDYRPSFEIYVRAVNWFRSYGFDVDNLIESGLAIDKTTL